MADDRQLYVLCDTNAAARDAHLFRKKGGPILVAMLRAKKAKLVMPEVLRMEYINPVSYTHLDVYKRQRVSRLVTRREVSQDGEEGRAQMHSLRAGIYSGRAQREASALLWISAVQSGKQARKPGQMAGEI